MKWYLLALKKYATFSGRARRKEFWMFALFNFLFLFLAAVLDNLLGTTIKIQSQSMYYGYLYYIYALAIVIPGLAVTVRRLHDIGKSGWFVLIALIPIVGAIWLLVLMCIDSNPGENEYGVNPKGIPTNFENAGPIDQGIIQEQKANIALLIFGYLFALLGGLIGLLIGQILWSSRIKLPDGSTVYKYDESSRKQGKIINIIAVVMIIVGLYFSIKMRS